MTRNELYNLVWSKPISKIIEEYEIGYQGLKELCYKHDVPMPKNGYWQKLSYNKIVEESALPPSKSNFDIILSKQGDNAPVQYDGSDLNTLKRAIKLNKSLPIEVPEKLIKPHRLVVEAKQSLANAKVSSFRELAGLYCTSTGIFDLYVSKEMIKRSLIFCDMLIKLFESRGHKVEVLRDRKYNGDNGTFLVVNDEFYKICVRECRVRVKNTTKYSREIYDFKPSGQLSLRMDDYPRYQWVDSKTKTIENKLVDILAYFEILSKKDKKQRIEREIRHQEYERQRKIEEELKQRRDKELREFRNVISHASRWQKSIDLRNYIDFVEKNAAERGALTDEMVGWIKWIRDKLDWYDPLIEKEDELFKNVDRDSL